MKAKFYLLFLLVSIAIINSCTKDSENIGDGQLKAKIDGTLFNSTALMTYYIEAAAPVGTTLIGQRLPDVSEIILHLPGLAATGTYTFVEGSLEYWAEWVDYPNSKTYKSIDGQLIITSIDADGKMSGTFSFSARLNGGTTIVNITEGELKKVVKKL
jgi:hypothetical protein